MNKELIDIIISIYGRDTVIDENTSLSNDLSFTSVHFVQLIVEIESKFGFEFDDDEMDLPKLDYVGFLNKIVRDHIG